MEARLDGGCGEKVFKGSSWLTAQPYVHIFLKEEGLTVTIKVVI